MDGFSDERQRELSVLQLTAFTIRAMIYSLESKPWLSEREEALQTIRIRLAEVEERIRSVEKEPPAVRAPVAVAARTGFRELLRWQKDAGEVEHRFTLIGAEANFIAEETARVTQSLRAACRLAKQTPSTLYRTTASVLRGRDQALERGGGPAAPAEAFDR